MQSALRILHSFTFKLLGTLSRSIPIAQTQDADISNQTLLYASCENNKDNLPPMLRQLLAYMQWTQHRLPRNCNDEQCFFLNTLKWAFTIYYLWAIKHARPHSCFSLEFILLLIYKRTILFLSIKNIIVSLLKLRISNFQIACIEIPLKAPLPRVKIKCRFNEI